MDIHINQIIGLIVGIQQIRVGIMVGSILIMDTIVAVIAVN